MKHKVYMNYVHPSSMMEHLTDLWKNGILCDAIITVNNVVMGKAHRPVLLAASAKMKSMFANPSQQLNSDICLPAGVSQQSVMTCLHYLYEGFLGITELNVGEVMLIAKYLEIESIIKCCENFMLKVMSGGDEGERTEHFKHYRFSDTVNISDFSRSVDDTFSPRRLETSESSTSSQPFRRSKISGSSSTKLPYLQPQVLSPTHSSSRSQSQEKSPRPQFTSTSSTLSEIPRMSQQLGLYRNLTDSQKSPQEPSLESVDSAKLPEHMLLPIKQEDAALSLTQDILVADDGMMHDISNSGTSGAVQISKIKEEDAIFIDSDEESDSSALDNSSLINFQYMVSSMESSETSYEPIPLILSKSYASQFSADEMLTNKRNHGRSSNAQLLFRMLLKEGLKSHGLWEKPPCLRDLSPAALQKLYDFIFNYAPQLKPYRDQLFSKIRRAMQNRRCRSLAQFQQTVMLKCKNSKDNGLSVYELTLSEYNRRAQGNVDGEEFFREPIAQEVLSKIKGFLASKGVCLK